MCICTLRNLNQSNLNCNLSIQQVRRNEILSAARTILELMIEYGIDMKEMMNYNPESIRSFDETYDTVFGIKNARKMFNKHLNLDCQTQSSSDDNEEKLKEILSTVDKAVKATLSDGSSVDTLEDLNEFLKQGIPAWQNAMLNKSVFQQQHYQVIIPPPIIV